MRTIMLFVALALTPSVGAAANTVEQEVERLLEAVGGRDVWAEATGFTMSEILFTDQRELPVYRQYWVDFDSPRILEHAHGRGLEQRNGLNGESGWTVRNGELSTWDAEQIAGWRSFWPGIPTRVFHLLASDDPSVEAVLADDILDIFVDGEWVVWIAMDPEGTPVAYGRENRHTDTHFLGRSLDYGNVRLWSEATEPGGDWRVVMLDYELLTQPHNVSFAAPNDDIPE